MGSRPSTTPLRTERVGPRGNAPSRASTACTVLGPSGVTNVFGPSRTAVTHVSGPNCHLPARSKPTEIRLRILRQELSLPNQVMRVRRPVQQEIAFANGHGGKRAGAGRRKDPA